MPQTTLSTYQPVPLSWIEKLFARMTAIYGNKFADMWPGTDLEAVKALWADELGKLSGQEIAAGVGKLMQQEWPPTLPQFIKLCRPDVDPLRAYYEAVEGMKNREKGEMGTWSHPATFWAAVDVSAFDLKNLSYSQVKGRWENALDKQIEKGSWEPVPQPVLAIAHEQKFLSPKEMQEKLKQLGASGVFEPKGDEKDWARRILSNPKNFPGLSVKFAREALGIEL